MIAVEEEEMEAKDSMMISFDMRSGTVNNSTLKVDYKKHQDDAKQYLKAKEKEGKDKEERQNHLKVDAFEMDTRLKKNQADILDGINSKYTTMARQAKNAHPPPRANFNAKVEHDDMFEEFSKA
jgi:hypothetical protein